MSLKLQQAEDLFELIKSSDDNTQQKLLMIEFAGKMLEWAMLDEASVNSISQTDILTDFFLQYQDAANHCHAFFANSLPHIEPELKAGEFEDQIRELDRTLARTVERSAEMRAGYEKLAGKKEQLAAELERLNELEKEFSRLKKLEEKLKPEYLARLEKETGQLRKVVEARKPELERLEEEHARLEETKQKIIFYFV